MNQFEAYKLYSALRMHFTTDYDFFKYHGKVNRSIEKYKALSAKERRAYQAIAEKQYPKTYLVGNFLFNPKNFVLDFSKDYYLTYRKYLDNGEYTFKKELIPVANHISTLFVTESNGLPRILNLYINGNVSIFFLSIFQHLLHWTKTIDNNFLTENYIKDVDKKYRFFYCKDINYKQIIIDVVQKSRRS